MKDGKPETIDEAVKYCKGFFAKQVPQHLEYVYCTVLNPALYDSSRCEFAGKKKLFRIIEQGKAGYASCYLCNQYVQGKG